MADREPPAPVRLTDEQVDEFISGLRRLSGDDLLGCAYIAARVLLERQVQTTRRPLEFYAMMGSLSDFAKKYNELHEET